MSEAAVGIVLGECGSKFARLKAVPGISDVLTLMFPRIGFRDCPTVLRELGLGVPRGWHKA